MANSRAKILGIGAPILDNVIVVTEAEFHRVNGQKGGMEVIDHKTLVKILEKCPNAPIILAGGSATNTIKGLAQFGHPCTLVGKIGSDQTARILLNALKKLAITPQYKVSTTPTGQAICLITPDKERTCRTCPGAAMELAAAELESHWFEDIDLVHIEGYSLLNQTLPDRAMTLAQEHGAKISFDLASFEIAHHYQEHIVKLISHHIDVLFANEIEVKALTGLDPERGCDILKDMCETVVVFLGEEGGWVARGDEKVRYPAFKASPLDTTGAGDLFASGFLHGYLQGSPLDECAKFGARTGSAVVEAHGAEIPPEIWSEIRQQFI